MSCKLLCLALVSAGIIFIMYKCLSKSEKYENIPVSDFLNNAALPVYARRFNGMMKKSKKKKKYIL